MRTCGRWPALAIRLEFRLTLALASFLPVQGALAEPCPPEAAPLSVSAGIDALSSYWFRGLQVTDRLTLQPQSTIAWEPAGLELGIWNSFAVRDRERLGCCDETDLSLTCTRGWNWGRRATEVSIGYTEYLFTGIPGDSSHTEEAVLSVAAEAPLSPSLACYYDLGLYDEVYLEASLFQGVSLRQEGESTLFAQVLLGAGSYGEPFGLRDIETRCGADIRLDAFTLSPLIGFGYVPAGPYRDDWDFFAGVSFTFGE